VRSLALRLETFVVAFLLKAVAAVLTVTILRGLKLHIEMASCLEASENGARELE
jgi:hypothetical protein